MCVSVLAVMNFSAWESDDDAIKERYIWSQQREYIKMVRAPSP